MAKVPSTKRLNTFHLFSLSRLDTKRIIQNRIFFLEFRPIRMHWPIAIVITCFVYRIQLRTHVPAGRYKIFRRNECKYYGSSYKWNRKRKNCSMWMKTMKFFIESISRERLLKVIWLRSAYVRSLLLLQTPPFSAKSRLLSFICLWHNIFFKCERALEQ